MAAMTSEENKPEIKISTHWGDICEASPSTRMSQIDSTNRPLPENAFLLHDLFSASECANLVQAAENEGGFGYTNYRKEYRGNLRLITVDISFTEVLWGRIKPFVPARLVIENEEWEAIGLNECWRISKYYPGDKFRPHYDASFARSNDEQSMYTVNAYMNGDFGGGQTRFYDHIRHGRKEVAAIKGTAGQCLVFMQPPGDKLAHDGEEVTDGLKYLFRSDVMYRRIGTVSKELSPQFDPVDDPIGLLVLEQAHNLELESKLPEAIEIYSRLKMFYPAVAEKHNVV